MKISVKLFAMVRDIVGSTDLIIEVPKRATAYSVLQSLVIQYPGLSKWEGYVRLAVNQEYITADIPLADNDEVAIIPPVSGG